MLNVTQMSGDVNRMNEQNVEELSNLSRTEELRANNLLIQQEIAKLERQKRFYLELFMDKIKLDLDKITPEQREFLNSFSEDDEQEE